MTVQHSYTLLKTRCIQLIRKARRTATSGIKFTAFMLITLLMSASAAWSDTNVSGTISTDTTWTLADSPYIVTGSITVLGTDGADATTTLTIEPGVEVRVNAYCAIYIGSYYSSVAGALVAQGTATDPIVFTSNLPSPAPGNWQGLFFYRGVNNDITVMDHCIVEYGGYGYGAFYINNASPLIQNTTIRNNINTAVYTAFGSPTLQGNTLSNNTSYGVHIASGSPIISGNTFSNNGNYDIYATATTDGTITGNTINNGIYIASGNTAGITGNTINYNNSYPIRLNAADIGELVSGNTLNNVDSQSHIQVTAGTIARDAVWKKFNYHLVNGNISVQGADGADATTTLTIEPGAQIRMNGMYAIYVGNYYSSVAGALRAVGGTSGTSINK